MRLGYLLAPEPSAAPDGWGVIGRTVAQLACLSRTAELAGCCS
jgi:hypothetical protein